MSTRYERVIRARRCKYMFWINVDYMQRSRPVKNVEMMERNVLRGTTLTLSPCVWSRICKKLGLSQHPNIIGQTKLSTYFEELPPDDFDMLKLECLLEGMK